MKKVLLSVVVLLTAVVAFAQTDSLLKWQIAIKHISDSTYEITAIAKAPEGWSVYAINPSVAGLEEAITVTYDYENAANTASINAAGKTQSITDPTFDNKPVDVYNETVNITQRFAISGTIPAEIKGRIVAYLGRPGEFQTAEQGFTLPLEGGKRADANANRILITNADTANPLSNCGEAKKDESGSLLTVFFLGLAGGLIALLTPCVFPMIPVTVSFFTKRSGSRKQAVKNGVLYGLFIFLIYTLASIPFHILGNVQPEIFNNISTNVWLNVVFFVIFIFFAISFFGFFEITLPSSIAGKADAKGSLGSIGGIFFMALTLAIVSFSCTGPILGSLLVGSLSGGAWELTAGLAGFGLALALPFALFAIFPHWLQSLPKSGGWLDTVKKVLAFAELGLALKFLSNADLVMHWELLKREVFIGLWIIISLCLTLYLFGVIRLPHDYKGMKIGKGRKVAGVVAMLFTLYLIPGVTSSEYANLKLLSGFPPPFSYSVYGRENVHNKGLEATVVNDYGKALQLSKEQDKPIMIDFTGWACVNCRKMEENVWTDPAVKQYIEKNFILVSLYVDDRAKLPVEQRFTYTTKTGFAKEIETIGDKWATFQQENFVQASQPLYVLLNGKEQVLNMPVGYTPDAEEYLAWLKCGKETFDKNR
ncbi:thioredoxin family protein [Panacibacter sp. DH6]|uniref:Thioredoxin family protein n=1 Tax=Panacibacter microcysteis TaxID=2793269 RepID=A0A931E7K3_9BACT|nr:thioredoxin family protein [Panacibacter microcysteis]MBG9376866.1 thioredoxin family protein [Panacibacter microcysteis]